jgi:hypothetical protein
MIVIGSAVVEVAEVPTVVDTEGSSTAASSL